MSRRKRKMARPPVAPSRKPVEPVSAAPAAPAASSRRLWIVGVVLVVAASLAGFFAPRIFPGPATAAKKAPVVVEGDGVKGPKNMVWVPGGDFLMGSDHKLAQR